MDVSWNYDEQGVPRDEEIRVRWADRKDYVAAVCLAEESKGYLPMLSDILRDQPVQALATAMRLYAHDGKPGWYSKVLDATCFPER